MALAATTNGLVLSALSSNIIKPRRIQAVASEDYVELKTNVLEKVKLGGSDLKVTKLGIGAWSWGDTSYWNNFEWDGINDFSSIFSIDFCDFVIRVLVLCLFIEFALQKGFFVCVNFLQFFLWKFDSVMIWMYEVMNYDL